MIKLQKITGPAIKRKLAMFLSNVLLMVILLGLCFLILQPLFNKVALSLMEEQDLYDSTIVTIPKHFTLFNYRVAMKVMDYPNALLETFLVSAGVSILQVISTMLVGYGFARYEFPLKKFWFAMVILIIVVPPQTYASALFLRFRFFDIFGIFERTTGSPLNLTGSVTPLLLLAATCTGLKNGLYIFLFRQYFRNIPKDIEEAAYIDGCGAFRTLFKIMLPDAIPLATSVFLFGFVWQWMDNYLGNLLMKSSRLLAVRVNNLAEAVSTLMKSTTSDLATPVVDITAYRYCINATATMLVLIPVIIVYIIAQKRFVESIGSSGMKM